MRNPDSLELLLAEGIITQVVRPLMSGKEAQVYLVESGGELRVAKIYKDAQHRSFKNKSGYTEGRSVRSSRDARAMNKRSKYGKAMDEEAWRSAEVDVIYRLQSAGVRVPEPFQFVDGVLIMELVKDADGEPAPRLGDLDLGPAQARAVFDRLLAEVVRMLCADIVHGDLSDFNVLIGADGPVIIDFPQSVDASKNQTARELLIRDVDNLTHFLSRHEPAMKKRPYGQEIWAAYERNELTPELVLTGEWRSASKEVDTHAMLNELAFVEEEEAKRRFKKGLAPLGGKKGEAHGGAARPSGGNHRHEHRRPDGGQGRPAGEQARASAARGGGEQARPQGQHTRPQGQHARPQGQHARPQDQHARPQDQHARPQDQHARPQSQRPRGQGQHDRPQGQHEQARGQQPRAQDPRARFQDGAGGRGQGDRRTVPVEHLPPRPTHAGRGPLPGERTAGQDRRGGQARPLDAAGRGPRGDQAPALRSSVELRTSGRRDASSDRPPAARALHPGQRPPLNDAGRGEQVTPSQKRRRRRRRSGEVAVSPAPRGQGPRDQSRPE